MGFERLQLEWCSLLVALRQGRNIELTACARTVGAVTEQVLCDVFRAHEETQGYWVDGVVFERVELAEQGVAAETLAWCADTRTQWQIPIQMLARFSEGPPLALALLELRVGDAAYPDLAAHRGVNARKRWPPAAWLHEFVLRPPETDAGLAPPG